MCGHTRISASPPVTYLFAGQILHRDSLGVRQPIDPGDVNWMTAGAGIVHSERTDAALRDRVNPLFGIQSWLALPRDEEERAPDFVHHAAASLPVIESGGARLRLIAGTGWGEESHVRTLWPLFYADAELAPGAAMPLDTGHEERAAYIVRGEVSIAGDVFEAGRMLVFRAGDAIGLMAGRDGARLLLLGGAVMDGPRHIFWNFVSSRPERIEQAKADWSNRRFPVVPQDSVEFIPLPEHRKIHPDSAPANENKPSPSVPPIL